MSKQPSYTIGLGQEGTTDCCLTLSNGTYRREYEVESDEWRILSFVAAHTSTGPITENHDAWVILNDIWDRHHPDDWGEY